MYMIDVLVVGVLFDYEWMVILFGIMGDIFEVIKKIISCNKDVKLRSIRDEFNESFIYN